MSSHSYYNGQFPDGRTDKKFRRMVAGVIGLIAVLILATLLQGCSPVKRMGAIAAKHPDALARLCAQNYPVKVIDSTRIEYRAGQTVYDTDVVYVDCDSVMKAYRYGEGVHKVNTKYVRVPCPPSSHQTDTITVDRYRQVENTAKVDVLTKDLNAANMDNARLKKSRNKWRTGGLVCAALLGVAIVLRFKKIV